MFSKIKAFLSGKKTYLVAISAIVAALVAFESDAVNAVEAIKMIIEAILAVTIRAGISSK